MISGFHHLTAITKDAEKNKTFYTDILGLRLVKQTVNQDNLIDLHLFYGDYKGTPGTILTFFELPRGGQRREEDSYIHEVLLKIPQGSLPFWKKRLTAGAVRLIENDEASCTFLDPDDMKISLIEVPGMIAPDQTMRHSDVPAEYQIIGIQGIHYTVSDLDQILEKAKENNITVEKIIDRGYFQSLYLREPSGLRIEIATDQPGFTLDEPLEKLGETFALPDFLEPKRKTIESTILNRKK